MGSLCCCGIIYSITNYYLATCPAIVSQPTRLHSWLGWTSSWARTDGRMMTAANVKWPRPSAQTHFAGQSFNCTPLARPHHPRLLPEVVIVRCVAAVVWTLDVFKAETEQRESRKLL